MARNGLKTVGDLKRALEEFPDDMPLAPAGYGPGHPLDQPYAADRSYTTYDYSGYYAVAEIPGPKEATPVKLPQTVCVVGGSALRAR